MHWGAQWEWEETRVRLGARGCRNFWSFCHRDMEVFPAIILTERPSWARSVFREFMGISL